MTDKKPIKDWRTMNMQSLYLLSKHAADPNNRKLAKSELDRRRAALPDSTKLEAHK